MSFKTAMNEFSNNKNVIFTVLGVGALLLLTCFLIDKNGPIEYDEDDDWFYNPANPCGPLYYDYGE